MIDRPSGNKIVASRVVPLIRVLPWLAIVVALATGCCTAISNNQWIGHKAPKISSPEDVAKHLRQTVNGEVGAFPRATGFLYAPFKRSGIFGWSDLGYDGEVTGVVQQSAKSTDQFLTVDVKLATLQIGGKKIPVTDKRYLRAEICLCDVKLAKEDWFRVGETIWMRGRMVWDGDGFVEIHPRSAAEVGRAGTMMKSQ